MTALTSKAMLVSLEVSQWQARKFDRKETAQLAIRHGVGDGLARVNKSLLGNNSSLEDIKKKTNAMRWDYYNNSLPWGQKGVNVIRADAYMDFVRRMGDHKYEWQQLVSVFVNDYPQLREDARVLLNGMYREEDYPTLTAVKAKFSCELTFFPIPERGDWRVNLSDDEMASLRKQTQDELNRSQTAAMKDCWARVHKVVEHAVERLSGTTKDPKTGEIRPAVFRDSLVENAREMCKVLTSLNIVDDPNLERIRSQIEGTLCGHSADTLRDDLGTRTVVADQMKAIMDKMGAFYTAPA